MKARLSGTVVVAATVECDPHTIDGAAPHGTMKCRHPGSGLPEGRVDHVDSALIPHRCPCVLEWKSAASGPAGPILELVDGSE